MDHGTRGEPGIRSGYLLPMRSTFDDFWQRSYVLIEEYKPDLTSAPLWEIQQAIRFNLFHLLQASARAEECRCAGRKVSRTCLRGPLLWAH